MNYNPDVHHRKSIRLKKYDYSGGGVYFVTLCAKNRKCLFGKITDGKLQLNETGQMIDGMWLQINQKYKHIHMGRYVVMPNHLHGIIIINEYNSKGGATPPLRKPTLGHMIAWFKYQSTKQYNELHHTPGTKLWQRNYYEHIIKNEDDLIRILKYISKNPILWVSDMSTPPAHAGRNRMSR